jgi:hypothetical protein
VKKLILSFLTLSAPVFAAGGGTLPFVGTMNTVEQNIVAAAYYAVLALTPIAGIAIYRTHHDWGSIGHGVLSLGAVAAIVLGSTALINLIPGAQGALI